MNTFQITNITENQLAIDLVGKNDIDDTVVIPAKSRVQVSITSEQADVIRKEYNTKISIKKIK